MEVVRDAQTVQDYLKRYPSLNVFGPDLAGNLKVFRFRPGELLTRGGEPAEHLFLFVRGKGKVYLSLENGKSLLVRFYHPPEIIGDVEVFSGLDYVCNLQAISRVTCLGTEIERVRQAAEDNNRLLKLFCNSLGRKIAGSNMLSAVNLRYPLENRLASYLAAVSEPDLPGDSRVNEIQTDNMTELAGLLGSSYRHLTRTINKFKRDGIIEKWGKDIVILDEKRLGELARDIYV